VNELIQALAVFALAAALVVPLMLKAEQLGLVDIPNARKVHDGPVPIVGGIAIVLAVSLGAVAFGLAQELFWVGVCSYMLLICGILDDKHNIRVSYRLMTQIMVAVILYLGTGTELMTVGSLWPGTELTLGVFALPFTVFCVLGVINAINMTDGIDGLSGSLVLVTLAALCLLIVVGVQATFMHLAMGGIAGFLLYNLRIAKSRAIVFMGDAGSTVLGLWIAYLLIGNSQGEAAVISPVAAAWFLGIPLLDAASVIIKRAILSRPLFGADRGHLHHYLVDSGRSVNQSVTVLVGAQMVLCGVGVAVSENPAFEPLAFWGFIGLVGFLVVATLKHQRTCAVEESPAEGNVAAG